MSTSILYHASNLKGIEFESANYLGNAIIFSAAMTDKFTKCPVCGCRYATYKGNKTRWLKIGPLGRKQALLKLLLHRLQCIDCKKNLVAEITIYGRQTSLYPVLCPDCS